MSIKEIALKIKSGLEHYFLTALIILIAFAAFGLGRLSKIEKGREPIKIVPASLASDELRRTTPPQVVASKKFVASRNGTKYYLTSCASANRIKAENKIYFTSADEARAAGLTPAANCPGL